MNFLIKISLIDYIKEIVRSYKEISSKKFINKFDQFKKKIKSSKSIEIVYGLRNFIGNANKFSHKKIRNNFYQVIAKKLKLLLKMMVLVFQKI